MVTVHYISRSSIEREWKRIYGVELPRDSPVSDIFTFIRNNAPARSIDVDASDTPRPPPTMTRPIEHRRSEEESENSYHSVATKPRGAAVVNIKSRTDEQDRLDDQLPVRDDSSDGMRNDCNEGAAVASRHLHAKTPHRRLTKGKNVGDRAILLQRIALQSISSCSDDERKQRFNDPSLESIRMIHAQPKTRSPKASNRSESVEISAAMVGGEESGNRVSNERRKRPRAPSDLLSSAKAKRTKKHCDIDLCVITTSATDEKDSDDFSDDGRDSISPTNIMDVPDKSHYTNVIDAPDEVRLPLNRRQVSTESDDVKKHSSSIVRVKLSDKKSTLQEPGINAAPYKSWDKRLEQLRQHFETHGDFECQKDEQLWRWISDQRCLFRQIVLEGKQNSLSERRIELLNSIGFDWNVDEKVEDTDDISVCDDNDCVTNMPRKLVRHNINRKIDDGERGYANKFSALHQANPPSRFLCRDEETRLWEDVGDKRAAEKVGQLIRKNDKDKKIVKRTAFVENAVTCRERNQATRCDGDGVSILIRPEEYVEDELRRLGKANGNHYVRKAGVDGVHNGQIMVRLKSKRYIIIDYGYIPSLRDHELAANHPHIAIPEGAGQTLCKTVDCTRVGVPVLLYDSMPDEPMSLYLSMGLCFNCQRALNEKRRTPKRKANDQPVNADSSSSSGNDARIRHTNHAADQTLTHAKCNPLDQDYGAEVPSLRTLLSLQRSNLRSDELGANTPRLLEKPTSHPTEVISNMKELVWNVATNENNLCYRYHQSVLPPLLVGEYDVVIPLTPHGLLLNVGEVKKGRVAFLGYHQFPDGSKGPAELKKLVRRCGDIIIAVNGQSIVMSKLDEILSILRRSTSFAFLRFIHHEYMVGGHTSCGLFTD